MMTSDYLRTLYDYNFWAHRRVWSCLETITDAQFVQDIGYSLGSIRGQIVHTMSAEWVWFSRLGGTSPAALLVDEDFPTRQAVRQRWDTVEAEVRAYLGKLDDAQLQQSFVYKNTKGTEFKQTRWEVLFHTLNHSTDHRSQVLAMLHQLNIPTLEHDMIIYFRHRETS